MTRQRFLELAVLALFVSIGFWAADAVAGPYEYCDMTVVGTSCGPSRNCNTVPACIAKGVICEVYEKRRGGCAPTFIWGCIHTNSCGGYCDGSSPYCTCPANDGCG